MIALSWLAHPIYALSHVKTVPRQGKVSSRTSYKGMGDDYQTNGEPNTFPNPFSKKTTSKHSGTMRVMHAKRHLVEIKRRASNIDLAVLGQYGLKSKLANKGPQLT